MQPQHPDWSANYLALRYRRNGFDCQDFVIKVQREIFKRRVTIPPKMPPQVVSPGDYQDGDIALFDSLRAGQHIGVLMVKNSRTYLVHNNLHKKGVSIEHFPAGVSPALQLVNVYRPA